jgi:hypothetical protein
VADFAACLSVAESLSGVSLAVSYFGFTPNIIYASPPSGLDVIVLNMLADKLGFTLRFVKEQGFENTRTTVGLIQKVWSNCC